MRYSNRSDVTFVKSLPLVALALMLGIAGCATRPSTPKTISIDSDPTGVRIEVNGADLGVTPTKYVVQMNEKGDFAGGWRDSPGIVFTAFPPEKSHDLYKQMKVFSQSSFSERGDRVPDKIFFDMHQDSGRQNQDPIRRK